jgi:hypothetical protein
MGDRSNSVCFEPVVHHAPLPDQLPSARLGQGGVFRAICSPCPHSGALK